MQQIPESRVPTNRNKTKFFAGGALIVVAIVVLIFNGIQSGGHYYMTLEELEAQESSLFNRGVRVNAPVDKESVDYDSQNITLKFDLIDPESGQRRAVVYNDPMPDLFMKSESVIVEGTINDAGTLEAHTILVKCPSKYEEGEGKAGEYEDYEKKGSQPDDSFENPFESLDY